MTKEQIGAVLKSLRLQIGKTQKDVARDMGRTQQIIGHWETGYSQPDANTLFELCAYYGTTVDSAFGLSKDRFNLTPPEQGHMEKYRALDRHGRRMVELVMAEELSRTEAVRELPKAELVDLLQFLTPVSAGQGIEMDGSAAYEHISVVSNAYTRNADYCLTVKGNSMEPKYFSGDIILVREQEDVDFGEIGVFIVDGRGYVKQKGEKRLISLNAAVPDIFVGPYDDFRCNGKVIGVLDPDWILIK